MGARHGFCPKCLVLQASGCMAESVTDRSAEGQVVDTGEPSPATAASNTHSNPERADPFGDYDLLEEIGRGGMGVVYRAWQRSLNRIVAIKMMAFGPGSSPELVKRFRAEAVSAASLHHPNIVAIHEVGIHEGQHFFVMDYVEGQSLARLVSNQPLPAKRAAAYLKTVAEVVHYAHERGILHRDLKPSNVLIDAQDQPHVVDFGLARRLEGESELTVTGQVLGSPHYLPPEQAAGQRGRVSRRTDVYALGATLYHLLTGRPPFQAESLAQTLDLVLHADPVAPRLLDPGVPRDLETICLKCLEKEPSRRYATARELADEMGRFQAGEPIRARPLGPAGKAWRWCRRKPQVAGLAALAILAVLLGFAGVLWQWRGARRNAAAEVQQRRRAEASELSLQHRAYVAEIFSAQQALNQNDPGRALELLNRHRPRDKSGSGDQEFEVDLRGFEWRYLWQQCQSEAEAEIGRLSNPICCLEVSGDGQWLFAGAIGGAPKLWNLITGDRVVVAGEAEWVFGAFSPDSRLLLVCPGRGDSNGTILVWDLQQRRHLEPITDPRRLGAIHFSANGRWVGFGVHHPPWGRRIVVLDFSTRERVPELIARTPLTGWEFGFDWMFTRDGRSVIFSENNPEPGIGLSDIGSSEAQRFRAHREPISAMALSPDGQMLATGAGYTDTIIKLWEVRSFRRLGELAGHQGWITALSFSPDGRTLASAGADQTWRLWDVPARAPGRVFGGLASDVLRLRFTPDGQKLFTGSRQGTVHRWSLTAPRPQPQPSMWSSPPGLSDYVVAPDLRRFAALRNREVYVGDLQAERLASPLVELGTNNTHLLFSPCGEFLFAGTQNGEVQVWSLRRQQLLKHLRDGDEPVKLLRQDPRGRVLVAVQSSADYEVEHPYPPHRITVWDTAEWRAQNSWVIRAPSRKLVSTDGRWLALNLARTIQVWSLSDPAKTTTLSFQGEIIDITFSPDGQLLAAGNAAGSVKIWKVPGFNVLTQFQADAHPVSALAFSTDSRRLATANEGGRIVRLWDVDTWQELITLACESPNVQHLLFTSDGSQLAARTSPGELRVWRAPSLTEIEAKEKKVRP